MGFRIVAIASGLVLTIYVVASIASETLSPKRPAFPQNLSQISVPPITDTDALAVTLSPFRGIVEANYAMAAAMNALKSDAETSASGRAFNNSAQNAAITALSLTPGDAQLWLVLALLRARVDTRDPTIREALRMSYFTAPNDATLIPIRLDAATVFGAVADPDLAELVRGDVRLILTRRPDLRSAISSAYRRGSAQGKQFLEAAVGAIDPQFLSSLRS